ncbi:phosphatidylinositol transfer protein csr1 [Saxophila tyrrhenica]|uniref:Phosphatidylinositol transfer protein csr1 n=1 Tax=Saxophila tyrrhenica TaxID=1690608 RepID=A0AAV9PJT5_9PEZI|nr:phosphatidylinositol transfer protein csr1 [Saxophila tyrrhenica]
MRPFRRLLRQPIPTRQHLHQRHPNTPPHHPADVLRPSRTTFYPSVQPLAPRLGAPSPKRSDLDPLALAIAFAGACLSGEYIIKKYYWDEDEDTEQENTDNTQKKDRADSTHHEEALSTLEHLERLAVLYPHTMAPNMPPGRPGNLTADQETKLKEMWLAVLEVFGVAHEPSQSNGTATPSDSTTTPDKKKKKSRLSLLGKKDKHDADGVDNDKHGQTREFQQALASQSPEALREAFWSMSKHDHPDALLLRFLRARKWDVQAALVMMISTMHWRSTEMHVDDDIMIKGEETALKESKSANAAEKKEGDDFMAQLRMGKSFLHGCDKEGRPCCWVRVRLHRQGEQSERSLERFTVYTIETARMMLRPPVDTATIVFDMTDFSMANMDYTPVKFMIKCFEANYPESLGSVLVYKSPWIFQGIWKIIRGWLDPVVAGKVHFASHVEDLQEFIPRDHIPKELGGTEEWTYSYVEPTEGENARMADTAGKEKVLEERKELVRSYESETMAWAHGEDKGEGRGRLAERLAENYWRADPFLRARSLYDRTGVLREGGKLEFYSSGKAAGAAAASTGGGPGDDEVD